MNPTDPTVHSYGTVNFGQLKIIWKNAKIFVYHYGGNGLDLNL